MSIKAFQANNGLIPDGVVGKKTISKIKEVYNMNIIEASHFLGQIDHETGGFVYNTENLNYSSDRLLQIFSKYFPTRELADKYSRKPRKIANKVYANRMGNGDESSGDGWKYKGHGSIQLTGFNNYKKFSEYVNDPEILENPSIINEKYYLETAYWYFKANNIFNICTDIEISTIKKVTKKINGGYNNLNHRIKLTEKYYNILKELEKNEEQDNNMGNTSNDSSNTSDVFSNPEKEQTDRKENTSRENTENKGRFSNSCIGRLLQAFSF